jgi:protoporphyrin/coproporphyrin ferrochelatase
MAGEQVALLLMAYGGPDSLDEVEPYLRDVRGGRPTAPELVAEIKRRYARIGGRSPIRELTEAQATGVQRALGERFAVYVGMRHWHPYIRDVVERIVADGHRRVVGIVLAPHYSAMSVGAYETRLLEAAAGRLERALVRSWGQHPKFLDAVAQRLAQALERFPAASRSAVHVLFTAHSLPQRILATGDPYPDELRASAAAVAQRVRLGAWHFAYQSAGATPEPWLGPEAGALMTELAGKGHRAFLIVPIGFVCDHVEVLYDVDVVYRELAGQLGVQLERTASLNDDPLLVGALAEIARDTAAARGWA